jgi:hypothetical protein
MAQRDFYNKLHRELDQLERETAGISSDLRRAINDHVKHDPTDQEMVVSLGEVIGLVRSAHQSLEEAHSQLGIILEFQWAHDEKLFKSS